MTQRDDGGPAFACAAVNGYQRGMSLRDYFAAAMLPDCIQYFEGMRTDHDSRGQAIAAAYAIADAMLAERQK